MTNPVFSCLCGDHCWRPLAWAVALCDPEYAPMLGQTWRVKLGPNTAYLVRTENIKEHGRRHSYHVMFHHIVKPIPRSYVVDHINRNGLDNRSRNLRAATLSMNAQNTPHYRKSSVGYRGVSARGKRFFAHIVKNDKQINLGFFDCEIEAARAYDAAARDLYGRHAVTNFPEERKSA